MKTQITTCEHCGMLIVQDYIEGQWLNSPLHDQLFCDKPDKDDLLRELSLEDDLRARHYSLQERLPHDF